MVFRRVLVLLAGCLVCSAILPVSPRAASPTFGSAPHPGSVVRGGPCALLLSVAGTPCAPLRINAQSNGAAASSSGEATSERALLDTYCVGCHNARLKSGNLQLDSADVSHVSAHPEIWERVITKLRGGLMPPPGRPRPEKASYDGFASWLEKELDTAALAHPNPGRTETLHRLNRTEYHNIVRDVLAVDVDFSDLLPIDDSGGGRASFDNIASSLRLSETLMEQYLSVALKVSRTAVGGTPPAAELTYKMSQELRQDEYIEGMPFGTRGGMLVNHIFPVDAEYELRVNTAGNGRGQIELTLDGDRVKLFDVVPQARQPVYDPDNPPPPPPPVLRNVTLPIKAGPHQMTVAFLKTTPAVQIENDRSPFEGGRSGQRMRGTAGDVGGALPGIDGLVIRGPMNVVGKGNTPSRQAIFVCHPETASAEESCAKTILTKLARRAYHRPITDHDAALLMAQYKEARADGDFESGVERGLRSILVNPSFLFRVERDPAHTTDGVYRIGDFELASRLSFFLWSSVPDDELLDLAGSSKLRQPDVLVKQVQRMLADPRSISLTNSFAAQWLWVRNLKAANPSEAIFPNFDEGLRDAFQREIELFFTSIVREDRSAIDLLNADYTFVNERLAKHYGIPNIYGTGFRRVTLEADSPRRGLLGKGEILLVTSRSTRTSPVVRGRWILENLLGTPPPAPPANVPPLPEQKQADGRVLTVRELMAQHRANPVCASCHATIDPAGFALEQFDATGKWRSVDAGFQPIDASGTLPDGTKFNNLNEFRSLLLQHPEQFVKTLTDKLMIYALGRGTDFYDGPAIRKIVRDAAASNYQFSSLVIGIVNSVPFQMRAAAQGQQLVADAR